MLKGWHLIGNTPAKRRRGENVRYNKQDPGTKKCSNAS